MKSFLVVDDDSSMTELYKLLIEKRYGDISISQANNGKEALDKAIVSAYSVILTDIDMPIMNGIDFHKALKEKSPQLAERTAFISASPHRMALAYLQEENLPYLPKIFEKDNFYEMIDAILEAEDARAKYFRSGCEDILVKPYEKQELLYMVKKHATVSTREHERKPVDIEVDCHIMMEAGYYNRAEIVLGKIVDIGMGGMLVEIKAPFPLDTYLQFNVFIDGYKNGIPAKGRVAWSKKQKMGIHFLYVPLHIEILIAEKA